MLGSLARWLRIGGIDVEYQRDTEDEEIIKQVKESERILISRDVVLIQRAKKNHVEAFLLPTMKDVEALKLLKKVYHLELDAEKSRCPKCNGILQNIESEKVKTHVPEGTWRNTIEFWECTKCSSIYWRGSHWSNISSFILNVMRS
jgi:hypothetical protein